MNSTTPLAPLKPAPRRQHGAARNQFYIIANTSLRPAASFSIIHGFDPCSADYEREYLNLPEVQLAMHANVTRLPYPWIECSDLLLYNWTDSSVTMHPALQELTNSGIRFWLYSGDQDAIVPVTATRYTINMLGLSVKASWRAWYHNGEVGGYVVRYKGLTFATARGVGHMVPSYQPERALTLLSSFLKGKPLPSQ